MDDKISVKKEIDGCIPSSQGLKFAPKKPPNKPAKVTPKMEPVEESKDETVDKELLMKLKTSQSTDPFGRRLKIEKNAFSPKSIHGLHLGKGTLPIQDLFLRGIIQQRQKYQKNMLIHGTIPIVIILLLCHLGGPTLGIVKFLMMRSLESSANRAQDGKLTTAEELGLMVRSATPQLLFFQLLSSLPLPNQTQSVEGPNTGSDENAELGSAVSEVTSGQKRPSSFQGSKIKDLPGGLIGKILIYKSVEVKMKIGDALFDVSPGSNCMFIQDVAAVNTREKHCCTLGEISKRAVVTPDVDYLLDPVNRKEE